MSIYEEFNKFSGKSISKTVVPDIVVDVVNYAVGHVKDCIFHG